VDPPSNPCLLRSFLTLINAGLLDLLASSESRIHLITHINHSITAMAPIANWDSLRHPLAQLLKGLTSLQSKDETQRVREAITHAVVSGQAWDTVDPAPVVADGSDDASPGPITTSIDRRNGTTVTEDDLRIIDSLRPRDDRDVINQRVCLRPAGVDESAAQPFIRYEHGVGLVPVSTRGPLVDALGRRLELVVFKLTGFTALRGGFMVNTTTTPVPGDLFASTFGACTLWIPAPPFAAAAPPNSYFGLRVLSGSLSAPPAPITAVTVQLAPQSPWESPLAARFSRALPSPVVFQISTAATPARGTLSTTSVDATATASVFGTHMSFRYANGRAEYDAAARRLAFPLTTETRNLSMADAETDLVHFFGKRALTRSAWSLPVVVFPTPAGLAAAAAGNGAISLSLGAGLQSRFLEDRNDIWSYGPVEMAIDETTVSISGGSAWTSATRNVGVWLHGSPESKQNNKAEATKRSTLGIKSKSVLRDPTRKGFPFRYVIQANGRESWSYSAAIAASLASPVTVDGTKASFAGSAAVLFTRTSPGVLPFAHIEAGRTGAQNGTSKKKKKTSSYLMENMLLSVSGTIDSLFAYGEYSGGGGNGSIVTGSITLPTALLSAVPMLPDPYATNIRPPANGDMEPIGGMLFRLRFDGVRDAKPKLDIQLPPNAAGRVDALAGSPFDPELAPSRRFKLPATTLWDDISAGRIEHSDRYASLEPYLRNAPALLDLSTNLSHYGVAFSPQDAPLTVRDMTASASANKVKMFCLPAVQWEAIAMVEPPPAQPILYPSAGIGTKMTTESVTLVPITPEHVLGEAVAAYNAVRGGGGGLVSAYFQLPFGMLAKATAERRPAPQPSKSVALTQPTFEMMMQPSSSPFSSNTTTATTLVGALQLSFRSPPDDEEYGFPGTAFLPYPTTHSPLPAFIAAEFNSAFASYAPLTGFDISGYGASLFSAWQPAGAPLVGISKVALDALVGRAAKQVVQMSSVLYPYGVRVIRTVTVLRLNNGRVEARDSGWVAASDGAYDFGDPEEGGERLRVHCGLVRGVRQVTDIKTVAGSENVVTFNCVVDLLDGANGGVVSVPAQGQRGYIVTRPAGGPTSPPPPPAALTASAYFKVLGDNQLGGPVDAVVRLGSSNQQLRVSRVLAGCCTTSNPRPAIDFPMELWGTPVVPTGGGQWAFTVKTEREPGKEVHAAVDAWGVPLIRTGLDAAAGAASAIRIAGAGSLRSAGSSAYSLIHSADSHRLMFPAPELPPSAGAAVDGWFASQVPVLADGFSLATCASAGVFPEAETCIPLAGASRLLKVLGTGHYEYAAGGPGGGARLALGELERTIRQDGHFASVVSTVGKVLADGTREGGLVDLAINTATGVKDLSLSHLSMITKGAGGKELSRVAGSLLSSAASSPVFQDAEHAFGELLGRVQSVVGFLNKLKVLPPLKVSMTNEWAMEVGTSMGLDDFLQRLGAGPGAEAIREIVQVLDFALKARTTLTSAVFTMSVDVAVKIPTGLGPTVLGVGGFRVQAGTEGNLVEMTLGAGIGVEFKVGPFGAAAYYSQSQSIIVSGDLYGVAATCVLRVHVNLVVAAADLLLEARLGLIGGPCRPHKTEGHAEDTIYAYAQVRIALHVSIFLVIDCSVEETAEWENNMNNGPCELALMEKMP